MAKRKTIAERNYERNRKAFDQLLDATAYKTEAANMADDTKQEIGATMLNLFDDMLRVHAGAGRFHRELWEQPLRIWSNDQGRGPCVGACVGTSQAQDEQSATLDQCAGQCYDRSRE